VKYGPYGTITLSGSAKVGLTFAYRYGVTFTETGLATGTWSVTIKGHTESAAATSSILFNLTNASYAYKVGAEVGYKSVGAPPKLVVSGAGTTVEVTFTTRA